MKNKNIMKKLIYILTFIASISFVNAQNIEFKDANFKDKKEDLKKAKENIKSGDEHLKLGNEKVLETKDGSIHFKTALTFYLKAQNFNPENADLNFKIGNCYIYTNDKSKAKTYVDKANKLDPECDKKMDLFLGMVYHLDGQYDQALKYYQNFETTRKAEDYVKFVDKMKKECKMAKDMQAKPVRAWVDIISDLNSEYDDFSPCITTDGSEIVLTSRRENGNTFQATGDYDAEIYWSEYTKGKWKNPAKLNGSINTPNKDDVASALSYTGQKLLMYTDNGGHMDIYESKLSGANWTSPDNISPNINNEFEQLYASYDFDDVKIYFITNKTSNEENGTDIMFSGVIDRAAHKYGTPVSAGMCNSRFSEGSVYMHPDGETMYLCSQGHDGMGGYDIFVSKKVGNAWTKPENMGYPINTPYDDMFFASTANGRFAYIASNRPGGKGGMDIYKVTFWGPEKKLLVDTEDYMLAGLTSPIADNQIEASVTVDKKAFTVFKGMTIDALTKKPVESTIEITDNTTAKLSSSPKSNSATGKFMLSLSSGKNYGIAVKADGYLFHSENFDIPANSEYNLVDKVIELRKIAIGSSIELRNVFFATGSSILTAESNAELDRLVKLMKDVPGLKVEIGGHTDNVGSESMNQKLSQDRAAAVVTYITGKGITKDRLTSAGYGSTKPIASNGSAEGKQQNRRTEFKITGN